MTKEDIERKLIEELRTEAAAAKSCFTTFSFQTIAFSAAVLGIIFNTIKDNPMSALAVIPGVSLLMIVCRIGIYKYMTANRNYGCQFYLEQSRIFWDKSQETNDLKKAWELMIKTRNWEQIFRVWRIIQPTIFRTIYRTPSTNIIDAIHPSMYQLTKEAKKQLSKYLTKEAKKQTSKYHPSLEKKDDVYPWFMVKTISRFKQVEYYSGTYLKNMLLLLLIMQYLFLIPLVIAIVNFLDENNPLYEGVKSAKVDLLILAFWILLTLIIFRHIRIYRRRKIIEDELLSIHSCAITWKMVVLAHYRTLKIAEQFCEKKRLTKSDICYFYNFDRFYLENIAKEAYEIANNVFQIHTWIDKST
jgi:uncharacterized membrane protein